MNHKITFSSEIPFGAWLYCDVFGWACRNMSHTLSAEIRLRQGFTHFSTAEEKPTEKPTGGPDIQSRALTK